MEKPSVSLAGVPGTACVACLIFSSVVPGVSQSLQADCTAGRGGTTSRPTASGPTDAWEDNGAHSAVSPGLTSTEVGQFQSRALERVCLREGLQMSGDWVSKHLFKPVNPREVALGSWATVSLYSAWRGEKRKVGARKASWE